MQLISALSLTCTRKFIGEEEHWENWMGKIEIWFLRIENSFICIPILLFPTSESRFMEKCRRRILLGKGQAWPITLSTPLLRMTQLLIRHFRGNNLHWKLFPAKNAQIPNSCFRWRSSTVSLLVKSTSPNYLYKLPRASKTIDWPLVSLIATPSHMVKSKKRHLCYFRCKYKQPMIL